MSTGDKVIKPPETPNQAYQRGRAEAMKVHSYRTKQGEEGAHCSACDTDYIDIGQHVEHMAEQAGIAARELRVKELAAEHEEREIAKAKEDAAKFRASGGVTIP